MALSAQHVSRHRTRAYTLIEALISLAIMAVVASLAICPLSSVNDSTRLDAALKRSTALLRYARMLAMSSGQPCSVEFNTTTQTIAVYLGTAATPAPNSLFAGNTCSLNLAADPAFAGVRISDITGAGSTPARFTYGILGTRTPAASGTMTVTFACGNAVAALTIPAVGDPQ
jgi:prepilin-type N-terminal cleavage/methylation domain-containing protein